MLTGHDWTTTPITADLLRGALDRNLFKMQHVLRLLTPAYMAPADPRVFENINTPQDWEAHGRGISPLY